MKFEDDPVSTKQVNNTPDITVSNKKEEKESDSDSKTKKGVTFAEEDSGSVHSKAKLDESSIYNESSNYNESGEDESEDPKSDLEKGKGLYASGSNPDFRSNKQK